MNHGFIYRAPEEGDYRQDGNIRLGGLPLLPNGQWDNFLPQDELQDRGLSTMACASFGTLNAIEILERQEFGDTTDWSDRFLAEKSGTTQNGNDPHTVAETLRKDGTVYESDWPYSPDIKTWGQFYQTPPYEITIRAQVEFKGKYDFGHQYVKTDPQSMMNALMYSPLGADVFAWNAPDTDGIYHRFGAISEHWICIYGYEKDKYWKCLDTYDNTRKKLSWDFGFSCVKQYTLHKQVLTNSPWSQAIIWLRQHWFGLFDYGRTFGAARSPQWRYVEEAFVREHPLCDYGNHKPTLLNPLNVHHVDMFSKNPERELDPTNLQSVCRFHHFYHSHFGNWKDSNPHTREDASLFTEELQTHRTTP